MTVSWLELDGAVNVRDLGGLPTDDGGQVQRGRLIRADNLQRLSERDVRALVDEVGVRDVVDLRTGVEVQSEGPGPITRETQVRVQHLSLFVEKGETTDVAATADQVTRVVLPWQERELPDSDDERRNGASGVYLAYLDDRPDSVVQALRTIAGSAGATVVHCAAGKDRTGVVIAFALAEVGVARDAIIDDYARTAERITAILDRLRASDTYREDIAAAGEDDDRHRPRADTMRDLLGAVDDHHGGVSRWLRDNGWTEDDAAALRAKLLD